MCQLINQNRVNYDTLSSYTLFLHHFCICITMIRVKLHRLKILNIFLFRTSPEKYKIQHFL